MIKLALTTLFSSLIINHSVAALDKESVIKKVEELVDEEDLNNLKKRLLDLALNLSRTPPSISHIKETHGEITVFYNKTIEGFVASQRSVTTLYETNTDVIIYDDGISESSAIVTTKPTDIGISGFTQPNPAVISALESKIAELKAAMKTHK